MFELFALARKDARLLLRDRAGFFFTFLWPVIMAMFFGSIFSGGGDSLGTIDVLVVDEDRSTASRDLLAELEATEELSLEATAEREAALTRVRRGQVAAALIVPEGFEAASANLFDPVTPLVLVAVDPARRAEAGMLSGLLLQAGAQRLQKTFSDTDSLRTEVSGARRDLAVSQLPGMEPVAEFLASFEELLTTNPNSFFAGGAGSDASPFEPLSIETLDVEPAAIEGRPANYFAISFPQGMIWGLLGCTAAFGISLVGERTQGTLTRLRTAPLDSWQILGGKALACFVTSQALVATVLLLGITIFGVRPGSYPLVAVAMVCSGFCFVGIMMLLSVVGKTEQAASGITWAALLLMAMIGGGMIPLFVMPGWMRALSHASPVKWSILAFEGAIWRGYSLQEMLLPCAVLLSVGVLAFALGLRAYRGNTAR